MDSDLEICSAKFDPKDINDYFRSNSGKAIYNVKEEALLIYMTVKKLWDPDVESRIEGAIFYYRVKKEKSLEYTSNKRLMMFRLSYLFDAHPGEEKEIAELLSKLPEDVISSVYINEYYYFDLPATRKILLSKRSNRLNYLVGERAKTLKTVNDVKSFIKLTGYEEVILMKLNYELFVQLDSMFNYKVGIYDIQDIIDNVEDNDVLKYIVERLEVKEKRKEQILDLRQNIPYDLKQYIRIVLSKWDIVFYTTENEYENYKIVIYPYIDFGNAYTINDLDRMETNIYPDSLVYRMMDEMYSLTYRIEGKLYSAYPLSENIVYYFLSLDNLQEFAYDQLRRIMNENNGTDHDYYRIHINNYQNMTDETTVRITEKQKITFVVNSPLTPAFTDKEILQSISPLKVQTDDKMILVTNYFVL